MQETEILVEQQHPEEVLMRGQAGLVINKLLPGVAKRREEGEDVGARLPL